jgi:hypothetical protein
MKFIFLLLVSSILALGSTFKIVGFDKLDNSFLAIEENTGGASCCTYIHIFKTVPEIEKIYTHNSDIMEFSSNNKIIRYEDKEGIDLSIYPLCCRPKEKIVIDLTKFLNQEKMEKEK